MNTKRRISVLIVSFIIVLGGYTGCSSSKPASSNNSDQPGNNYGYTNILEMLRKEPGLRIIGSNANPAITVNGSGRSIAASNEPLFVVDGTPAGQGYNNVRHIDVNVVESIKVLSPTQAGKYGARGAMGVIEIYTKTTR
jgi:outer membrane receptor protein involved in Fe transport